MIDDTAGDLTTTRAAYIDQAVRERRLYVAQPYALYSPGNHETWRRLYARLLPRWREHANGTFLEGLAALHLDEDRVPRLEHVNRFMQARTGFRAVAVSGYVPAVEFFEKLRRWQFPTTITIRDGAALDYLPEPDIFHDIAGHVPMHMDVQFANVLVQLGICSLRAAQRLTDVPDAAKRARCLASAQRALARFFWFTIEFGLMRPARGEPLKAYGSGLLSSFGELEHAIRSTEVQRLPFDLETVVNQPFEIDHYQERLFVVEGFHQLRKEVYGLQTWLEDGRLDDVAPGAPGP
jgi:phenylalanine-4-hydroxylase